MVNTHEEEGRAQDAHACVAHTFLHNLLFNINEVYSLAIAQSVLSLHGEHTVCSLPTGICSEYVLSVRPIGAQGAVFKRVIKNTKHRNRRRRRRENSAWWKTTFWA